MSDIREALAAIISATEDEHGISMPGTFGDAADAILAEFLVVPRSEIQGTQYAWRNFDEQGGEWVWPCHSRDVAIADASSARRRDRAHGREPIAEALARPIPPWAIIPLPEEPQS